MVPGEMPNFVYDVGYRKLLAFGSIGTLRGRLMKSGQGLLSVNNVELTLLFQWSYARRSKENGERYD